MKQTYSRSFATRASLTACAALLCASVAVAQSTGTSSSTSGTSSRDQSSRTQSGSYDARDSAGTGTAQDHATTGTSTYGSGGSSSTTGSAGSTGRTYGSGTTDTRATTGQTRGETGATRMTGRTSDKLSWGDRRFVNKAADSSATELQLAKLAQQQASNSEVKNFAQELIESHTNVNSELMQLASIKNLDIDKEDLGKPRIVRRLSNKQGSDFDQEFVEEMVDMHEADVKMFEKAAKDAKDPELRSFAAKHVDHLRQHLQKAQSLRATVMPTGRTEPLSPEPVSLP